MRGLNNRGGGRKRAPAVAAATIEEARERLASTGAGGVRFTVVPPDLERLRDLPPAAGIELPYREDLLPIARDLRPRARLRVSCRGFPSFDTARAALLALSREGIPSAIEDVDSLGPEEAVDLLDLFLHDPAAAAPIEPFAALLCAAIRKRPLGLWDVFPVPPAGPGRPAGARGPEEFLLALPREHLECLACACFPACEAYGAWAGSCATWRAVIEGIARAARELAAMLRCGEG